MKLLFTSDLHGSESHYTRLIGLCAKAKPEVIVLGGDMLPDDSAITPNRMGRGQPEYVRGTFQDIVGSMRQASGCKTILVIFGNHDWGSSVTAMGELAQKGLVKILDLTHPVNIEGIDFLGYSCTPPTPFYVKDFERLDLPNDIVPLLGGARWDPRFGRPGTHGAGVIFKQRSVSIAEELSGFAPPKGAWVWVTHAPPYDSKLDTMHNGQLAGSKAIRTAIEKHQPMLSLHGHIHDSPKVTGQHRTTIGKTIAANPGQEGSALHYLLIDLEPTTSSVRGMEYGQQA